MSTTENWFLAYTKPRSEDHVAYRLIDAGFEILNPKINERKYYRRKITDVITPLFPSYLFVKFDRIRDYHLIKYTRGIKCVLRNDDGPAPVPEPVIASIMNRMEHGVVSIKTHFTPGQTVRVKGGPFEGLEAVFEREMNGIERVSILFKAINIRIVVDGRLLMRV